MMNGHLRDSLSVVILTKDEELHIERAINSVSEFASEVLIVDSGSTDDTVGIAKRLGAKVISNPWVNYSQQINFGFSRVDPESNWIMRLDADEYVTVDLQEQIKKFLLDGGRGYNGVFVRRRMCFLGAPIKWGGIFPIEIIRIFRRGYGWCEERWMDEHLIVDGPSFHLSGELIDNNLKPLSWWIEKHNGYASREAIDVLNQKYRFMKIETISSDIRSQASFKRFLKETVYSRIPLGVRPFIYFFYRYCLRLGFLDGTKGFLFHSLQGLWYRLLVDAKLYEVELYRGGYDCSIQEAIKAVLGVDLTQSLVETSR